MKPFAIWNTNSIANLPLSAFYNRTARFSIALTSLVLFCMLSAHASEYKIDQTTGYRMERYRAPVPTSVPGGQTVGNEFIANAVANNSAVFIDVYPPKGLGPDPLDGTWLTDEVRQTIPGAIWLPEVGRGHLEPEALDYFKRNLLIASDGDTDTALVFFCTADCWQSWNATVRATKLGYTNVVWYPLGTDGWAEINGALEVAEAVNFLGEESEENIKLENSNTVNSLGLPASASIYLIDQQGDETRIGDINFSQHGSGPVGFSVAIDAPEFSDHFLSMRPFKCLTPAKEWFCQQPYPYELDNTITKDDLSDLEYHLLFIRKTSDQFGIDAWNDIYYKLALGEGGLTGNLLEGDLNVLQSPPPKGVKPIDLSEFFGADAPNRAYPTLSIRP